MEYNGILERIGKFYAGLELGEWTDFLSAKPDGFDEMNLNDRLSCTYPLTQKIDKMMEDVWQIISIWSRRLYLKTSSSDSDDFNAFMEYELDYLKQKEKLQDQKSMKKRFWNRSYK